MSFTNGIHLANAIISLTEGKVLDIPLGSRLVIYISAAGTTATLDGEPYPIELEGEVANMLSSALTAQGAIAELEA